MTKGSRLNLLRQAAAILNRRYEAQRAAYRQLVSIISLKR